jgi:16S rRNA (cytosine967-C5)-methyltransferase
MRLGGRLAAAIEVLADMDARHRPASDALKDWGLSHRFAGAKDRSAIGNLVYDALRRRRSANWILDTDSARGAVLGALLLAGDATLDGLDEAFSGDRHAPEALTAAERSAFAARRLADAPDDVRADVPEWTVPLLQTAFGGAWIAEASALAARPPLDLRVNTLLADRERVMLSLEETGARPSPLSPVGLRVPPIQGDGRHPNVQVEPAFQKGWVEIQDEGSQVAALLAAPEAGARVLDYCAGAGGKSLAMAAAMANQGRIVAFDAEKARLAPIFDRVRRAGASIVDAVAKKAEFADLAGAADLVLVDAPCTGSGTWRRRPDAKWRLSQRQLEQRQGEQAAILAEASTYVRPGGRLAYVTCSVFAEENDARVAAFLAEHPDFAADGPAAIVSRLPSLDGHLRPTAHGIGLTPMTSGTDGFYFCSMTRTA